MPTEEVREIIEGNGVRIDRHIITSLPLRGRAHIAHRDTIADESRGSNAGQLIHRVTEDLRDDPPGVVSRRA